MSTNVEMAKFMVKTIQENITLMNTQLAMAKQLQKAAEKDVKEAKEKEAKANKPKKSAKDVDENKPKAVRTAYQIFMMEALAPFKLANPEMNQKDIMTEIGHMWSNLDGSAKAQYEQKKAAAKIEYDAAMLLYNATLVAPTPIPSAATIDSVSSDDSSSEEDDVLAVPLTTTKMSKVKPAAKTAEAADPMVVPDAKKEKKEKKNKRTDETVKKEKKSKAN